MNSLLKKPSAWMPIAMSLASMAILLGYISIFGINQKPQADEGTAARLFQILMGGQAPIIVFFLMKYLIKSPKQALQVLVLQIFAAGAPLGLLYFFEH